jgi:hypothetical protein
VLWIRCGFNAGPDPAVYLNADPDPGIQTNADPNLDPGQTLKSHKVEYLHEKYHFCGSGMFILDLKFTHPGSRVKKIRDPGSGSASKEFKYF